MKNPDKRNPTAPPSPRTNPRTALPVRPENLAFAKKLREAMAEKQMSASDLARAIWGTSPDPRGYPVAKNRDRIGTYLAGTGFPSKESLPKLAAALGISVDDLPTPRRSTSVREFSGQGDVVFTMLADRPGMCSLRVVKLLPIEIGLRIIALINGVLDEEELSGKPRGNSPRAAPMLPPTIAE